MGLFQNGNEIRGFDGTADHGGERPTASPHVGATTNGLTPDEMSADERLNEVSDLITTAILRRRVRQGQR